MTSLIWLDDPILGNVCVSLTSERDELGVEKSVSIRTNDTGKNQRYFIATGNRLEGRVGK